MMLETDLGEKRNWITEEDILHKVKDRNSIAYRRKQAGAIGSKEQIALTVDRPQQVGEL